METVSRERVHETALRRPGRPWAVGTIVTLGAVSAILLGEGRPNGALIGMTIVAISLLAAWAWTTETPAGGWICLVFGSLGVAVGVGVGLRHVIAGDPGWRAVLGVVTLVTALITVGGASRRLVSRFSTPRKILAMIGLVAVVAVVSWTLTPAVIATSVPDTAHGARTPEDLGMHAEEVILTTDDGVEVWAWYVESRNGRAVVLRHGSGSNTTATLEHAAVLAGDGYGVLMMDARGHGNSDGRAMDFGWHGDSDIGAGVSFLVARPEVDEHGVALMGMSMGGEEAVGAMAADPRIVAAVAEGVTARTAEDKAWFDDVYGWRGTIQIGLERLQYAFADLLTDARKPIALADAARTASPRPILLITGGAVVDEGNAAEHIRQGSPGNVTIWTVPEAGHIEGLQTAPDAWEDTVLGFLEEAFSDE